MTPLHALMLFFAIVAAFLLVGWMLARHGERVARRDWGDES